MSSVDAMEKGAAGTTLLQTVAKQRRIVLCAGPPAQGWNETKFSGNFPVQGESGELIATVKFATEHAVNDVCKAEIFAPDGSLLASFEAPGLRAQKDLAGQEMHGLSVTVGSEVYATCSMIQDRVWGGLLGMTTKVSRADGSGGSILMPLQLRSMRKLCCFGCATLICVIGLFIIVFVLIKGLLFPAYGKAASLDGSKAYPPYALFANATTLHFVPQNKKDIFAEVDSMSKLDLFIAATVGQVMAEVERLQQGDTSP